MCVWGYLRHYINLKILYSMLTEFETVGPFELNWETQQYKSRLSQWIGGSLLVALQAVNLFWWFFICRIAYRFVVFNTADDDRSEYEPTDEEGEGGLVDEKAGEKVGGLIEEAKEAHGLEQVLEATGSQEDAETIGSRVKQRKKGGQA